MAYPEQMTIRQRILEKAKKDKQHRCMRCNEIFNCPAPDGCMANFDVLPIAGWIAHQCPIQPDWDWIRAYGERRSEAAAREAAILIRERLKERYNAHRRTNPSHSYDLGWGDGIDASAQYVDDLLASLVSAETPLVSGEGESRRENTEELMRAATTRASSASLTRAATTEADRD